MNDKKPLKFKVSILVLLVLVVIGITYAIYSGSFLGEKNQNITTATLILDLDDSFSEGINLLNTIPVTDEVGLSYTPYSFTVKNNGSIAANYTLKIIDDEAKYVSDSCGDKKLAWSNIKYSISKNNGTEIIGLLSTDAGTFETGTISPETTNTYTLKLWIDQDATNEIMGKHFHGLIQLDATQ